MPVASRRALSIALLLALPAVCAAATPAPLLRVDTPEEFDRCYRDRYLDTASEPGAAKLVHRVLVTDDMGKGYNDMQEVRGKTQARKTLLVDDPGVASAQLMIGGDVQKLEIVVNGRVLDAKPLPRDYWNGDFDRFMVPPALLKKGANEFVFRAKDGDPKSTGSIRIENSQQPDRSAVSRDGGFAWDSDRLAEGGYCNGEFQVRLSLERYAPRAWLRSPVIDLSAASPEGGLPRAFDDESKVTELTVDADTPAGTAIEAMVRVGPTPDAYEENWSRWHAWPAERDAIRSARFAQWQLILKTDAAQKTPTVRVVRLAHQLTIERQRQAPAFKSINIVEDDNQAIVRSSYDFAYADYDGNSRPLREHFKLAEVIASPSTEFEKLKALRVWVREQWRDGWNWGPLQYIPSWDARVILTMAPKGLSLGMCTHYATTYVQCSNALGYVSRSIFRGHALSESWSNEYKKWMVMDAGFDPNKERRATYHFVRRGAPDVPLSELEVHRAYWLDKKWDDLEVVATNQSEAAAKPEPALGATPEDREAIFKGMAEIFLPLRNNFIDHREPEEPEHGQGYFKFLGFLLWKDASTPDVPWTDFFTTREADLYWTLNQAQIFLRAPMGGDPVPRIPVMLDTVTPNFAGYEWRIDGGPWATWTPAPGAPVASPPATQPAGVKAYPMRPIGGAVELPWTMHAGRNTLEARPFNKAGLRGITSRIVVEAQE